MRIERVVARAFGPFQNEVLELGPGLSVVAGPNESGKSTWHAALRLAITGVRRGKGPGTLIERQLAERHRPWDLPDRWEVEARLALDDGRTIDISQDLAAKVACRAVDVALGRDVSDEIMDGTPDASRWLGLDRDSFAATVSVGQSQILAVADAAEGLQEHMQRAAATRGSDATAAEAITRLEEFRRDAVGADTVAAKGPLRTAKNRVAAAESNLAEARRQHADYLERSAAVEELELRAAEAGQRLAGADAAHARMLATEAAARAVRAQELADRYPSQPPSIAARDEHADRVATALQAWAGRPEVPILDDRTAATISSEIASLPPTPVGDTRPHASVTEALRAVDLVGEAVALLGERPPVPDGAGSEAEVRALRELARRLRTPQLSAPPTPTSDGRSASSPGASRAMIAIAAAGLGLLAAAILFATGSTILAAILLGVGLAAGAAGAILSGSGKRDSSAAYGEADAALAAYRQALADAERDRADAVAEAARRGVAADPAAIDELADRMASATDRAARATDWDARLATLRTRQTAAIGRLRQSLSDRTVELADTDDPRHAADAYLAACEARAQEASLVSRGDALRAELAGRQAAEAAREAALARRDGAMKALRDTAAATGLDAIGEPETLVGGLEAWQAARGDELRRGQQALAEWQQLQALLDGGTIEELHAESSRRRQRATELAAALPPRSVALPDLADPEGHLTALRGETARLSREFDLARGSLETRRDSLPDVAEAEEAAESAAAELARVHTLAATIDATLRLLRSAQDRVHRDLAPVLGQAAGRWLPVVSGGAYSEISVDPADLNVTVKEGATGRWRTARLLSEGTREQIFLLLRVAMAEHLVTTNERAPLILDEVTAQSDAERKGQLLDVLHRLSAERQVVLFTHDDDVVAWAEQALRAPQDRLVRLDGPRRMAPVPMEPTSEAIPEPVRAAD
ncbi:MAG TPA: AAA family ATPase [Candidatus Limnocylindria bacterium]